MPDYLSIHDNSSNFIDAVESDDEIIKKISALLDEAKQSYIKNEMSYEEFSEIAEDLLDIDRILELTEDIDRKRRIRKALEIFILVVEALPKP